jgi:hypothetical protein
MWSSRSRPFGYPELLQTTRWWRVCWWQRQWQPAQVTQGSDITGWGSTCQWITWAGEAAQIYVRTDHLVWTSSLTALLSMYAYERAAQPDGLYDGQSSGTHAEVKNLPDVPKRVLRLYGIIAGWDGIVPIFRSVGTLIFSHIISPSAP